MGLFCFATDVPGNLEGNTGVVELSHTYFSRDPNAVFMFVVGEFRWFVGLGFAWRYNHTRDGELVLSSTIRAI